MLRRTFRYLSHHNFPRYAENFLNHRLESWLTKLTLLESKNTRWSQLKCCVSVPLGWMCPPLYSSKQLLLLPSAYFLRSVSMLPCNWHRCNRYVRAPVFLLFFRNAAIPIKAAQHTFEVPLYVLFWNRIWEVVEMFTNY